MSVATNQFTTLLPNDVLARAERMRLNPLRRRTNRMRGEHMSGKGGTSIEFSDFREYVPGDDVRYIDWNIFSRLNEPYLKLYAHEEEMHVAILLDSSASMQFEGKFELARQVAAALGVMGLMSVERVSVYTCGQGRGQAPFLKPCSGRVSLKRFFQFLEQTEPGGSIPIEQCLEDVLKQHSGKGIAVVISDFLTYGDVSRSFNLLHGSGLEIYGLQILGPTELNPELAGDMRFVDAESNATLDVSSVGELLGLYHQHRQALEDYLGAQCRKRSGRFISTSSETPVKTLLFDQLLRNAWIR
ncbi:DUF58 domain-containing protein [Thalassoglobus polymorphus]|uniref:VWFA domain-containing protein n=1 Tax=Thalassoglobus polymorphus TaxID=2527994 RepID=A0A517QU90_9PLAN|nr:DUF58 domain-containing protein [Thalassoglobus polymorphus]QDT35209.1 hypothetical protein Mal48_44850 [Thalassoglobus polymorphus]